MKRFYWILPVFLLCLFGALSVGTEKDYGWNWDVFQHLARGQAYWRYFTTRKTDNIDVVPYEGRMSYYERTPFDFNWANKMTIGHPPATDIILAGFNQLLFKRLGWVEDLVAYHMYGVVVTFLAAVSILLWSLETSGWIGASISVLSFYGFPLLFSEQHFNIKDPAITAYSAIGLYFFWLGVTRKKTVFILFAAFVAGISLGTKFNVLFVFPVLFFWLFWYGRYPRFAFIIPAVAFGIFYVSYPALWDNPIQKVLSVVSYYQTIGGNRCPYVFSTGLWFVRCTDWGTLKLFIMTIPFVTLIFAGIGSIVSLKTLGRYKFAPLLWFVYLFSVVFRVILPVNSLYGGSLRQIMEIIVPMSLLSGLGAAWIFTKYNKFGLLLLAFYIPLFTRMVMLHPHENLYTNFSAGPVFVNGVVSYGNAYKPAVDWINRNVEKGASVSLVTGIGSAIPNNVFRSDKQYGSHWSGYDQRGEYLLEMVYVDSHATQYFPYKYALNLLEPLYEKTIDGYPIVRVWKNDGMHTKSDIGVPLAEKIKNHSSADDEIIFALDQPSNLKSLEIKISDPACQDYLLDSYILVSSDGTLYKRMYETVRELGKVENGIITYPFGGDEAAYIKIFSYGNGTCDRSGVMFEVGGFSRPVFASRQ